MKKFRLFTFNDGIEIWFCRENKQYFLTDGYLTDWIVFYKPKSWALDGYFGISREDLGFEKCSLIDKLSMIPIEGA